MTNEDKQIVADYMGWTEISAEDPMNKGVFEKILLKNNNCEAHFDLNDAALCAAEMQKRGDWNRFLNHGFNSLIDVYGFMAHNFIATLFRADNFFKAFIEWRKGK